MLTMEKKMYEASLVAQQYEDLRRQSKVDQIQIGGYSNTGQTTQERKDQSRKANLEKQRKLFE